MSPLRRIPVLSDVGVTLCDSTVICEYLDEVCAGPPLLPDPIQKSPIEFCLPREPFLHPGTRGALGQSRHREITRWCG